MTIPDDILDYFAGCALTGLLAHSLNDAQRGNWVNNCDPVGLADHCYKLSRAMMVARESLPTANGWLLINTEFGGHKWYTSDQIGKLVDAILDCPPFTDPQIHQFSRALSRLQMGQSLTLNGHEVIAVHRPEGSV